MRKLMVPIIVLAVALGVVACQPSPQTPPTPVEVTRIVEVTREVVKEVVVTPPSPAQQAYEWLPTSLHGTTRGMAFWYSKENGGMEILTGIPYEKLPCRHCHALYNKVEGKVGQPRCEACHIGPYEVAPGHAIVKLPHFPDDGRAQGCLACHGRQRFEWGATRVRLDAEGKPVLDPVTGITMTEPLVTDVHRNPPPYGKGLGMTCVNCHTIGDTHGDGNIYNSLLESPNPYCTDCHPKEHLSKTPGHTIHLEEVTCEACHAQTVESCQSCHLNGPLAGLPEYPHARVVGWKFLLLNNEGKYDLGNIMAVVYTTEQGEVKTFAAIGPFHSHSIQKAQTREQKVALCVSCHASEVIKTYQETGQIVLSKWDPQQGKLVFPTKGVIPVVSDYQKAFQLSYAVITNIDEVLAAKKEGKPQPELEKMTKWALGKEGTDLWQMLFAKPLEKLPTQMPKEALEAMIP